MPIAVGSDGGIPSTSAPSLTGRYRIAVRPAGRGSGEQTGAKAGYSLNSLTAPSRAASRSRPR